MSRKRLTAIKNQPSARGKVQKMILVNYDSESSEEDGVKQRLAVDYTSNSSAIRHLRERLDSVLRDSRLDDEEKLLEHKKLLRKIRQLQSEEENQKKNNFKLAVDDLRSMRFERAASDDRLSNEHVSTRLGEANVQSGSHEVSVASSQKSVNKKAKTNASSNDKEEKKTPKSHRTKLQRARRRLEWQLLQS